MKTMLKTQIFRILLAGILVLSISAPAGSHMNAAASHSFSDEAVRTREIFAYINRYIDRNIESLEKIRKKNKHTFRMMDGVFTKFDLPLELKYLAVIESELKPTAVSRVGAVGTWQLMPETARILGLKITDKYDERTHTYKSTKAAAIYLCDLHNEFNDWLLVLAAYNCGPGPVYKAIKKSGSRDFWKLQNYLPLESRTHVKRFIATHYYFEGAAVPLQNGIF